MIQYRLAEPSDADALAPLNGQLIRDEGHRNPMNVAQLAERMRSWLAGEYASLLAEDAGQIIGYALFKTESDWVYIRHLFVIETHRRRGLGRELVDHVWQFAPETVSRLRIDVLAGNTAGQRFWHSLGFQDYAITMETERSERKAISSNP